MIGCVCQKSFWYSDDSVTVNSSLKIQCDVAHCWFLHLRFKFKIRSYGFSIQEKLRFKTLKLVHPFFKSDRWPSHGRRLQTRDSPLLRNDRFRRRNLGRNRTRPARGQTRRDRWWSFLLCLSAGQRSFRAAKQDFEGWKNIVCRVYTLSWKIII